MIEEFKKSKRFNIIYAIKNGGENVFKRCKVNLNCKVLSRIRLPLFCGPKNAIQSAVNTNLHSPWHKYLWKCIREGLGINRKIALELISTPKQPFTEN